MYCKLFKPIIDFLISFIAVIVLSPLILILSILVYFKLGNPVLFCQKRVGMNEKIFTLYKFRTMTDDCDKSGELLPDIERLTRFGSFLRKSSLDELPQLYNVLKGDLSLIGPRPLLVEYLLHYNKFQKRRHNVRPGITGWAQVNGRNAILWDEKFKLDVYYVENISLRLDLKIMFKTLISVTKRSDIYNSEGLAMEKFNGNKQ
jgi:lipopolysaccharide/colanic/teichoic acid biosynthesis glycosyltransferase